MKRLLLFLLMATNSVAGPRGAWNIAPLVTEQVVHCPFEGETDSTSVIDLASATTFDVSAVTSPRLIESKIGKGVNITTDKVSRPHTSSIGFTTGPFTVAGIFRYQSSELNLVEKYHHGDLVPNNSGYGLIYNSGAFYAGLRNGPSNYWSGQVAFVTDWIHFVWVIPSDGTNPVIYINGNIYNFGAWAGISGTATSTIADTGQELSLGQGNLFDSIQESGNGVISELRIFNVALTEAQAKALYRLSN